MSDQERIVIQKTGPYWKPQERDQWFAQYDNGQAGHYGEYAFGKTPEEALANLLK